MTHYIRSFICTVFYLLSMSSYAVDHIMCRLSDSGIPAQTQTGQSYANTYTCINTYPETDAYPPIQLVGTVLGNSSGISVSGSCTTQKLASDDSCQFILTAQFPRAGRVKFHLRVSVGSLYYIDLRPVTTKVNPGPSIPTIIWPGSNAGSAQVDNAGTGSGYYVANARDTSGHPITYTFSLSGSGTVAGNQNGSFSLSGINTSAPGTITVTATADDASPVVGTPIQINANPNQIPHKVIAFYNNSNETVYPIIEAPILAPADPWLQGLFQISQANINTYTFTQTKIHRAYVNGTNGISPGQTVLVDVPFYSELVANPSGGNQPDQYVDWWDAMRVYLYDVQSNLVAQYTQDSANPVTPVTPGPTCISGCSQINLFSSSTGVPTNDPQQLTEYTFADVVTTLGAPYPTDLTHVDYDYSGVDQIYLSVAMEPYGTSLVGYTGTTVDLPTFRSNIGVFLSSTQWPVYAGLPVTKPRVPGAYNVMIGNPQLTATQAQINALTNNWHTCLSDAGNSNHANCLTVQSLFQNNAAACSVSPSEAVLLQHIYGYVSFCAIVLPSSGPQFDAYTAVQHNFLGYPQDFNPYTQLVHQTLKMNVYAYSVDDAVGNINTIGDGVIYAIGGSNGLTNPEQYDPNKITTVNPGSTGSAPYISKFGVCSATATNSLAPGASFSFQLPSSSYPCEITLEDTNGSFYHFTVLSPAPFTTPPTSNYISCAVGDSWCAAININFGTQVNIGTPPPT